MQSIISFVAKLLTIFILAGLFPACSRKDKTTAFLDVAKKQFDAGEYEKAKATYLSVLRKEPANAAALTQIGLIWMEQGAPRRAAPFLLEVSSRAPTDIGLRTKLVTVLVMLQDYARAYTEASAILQLDPGNEAALLHLATSARTPEQIQAAQKAIAAFPARNSAAFHTAPAPLILRVAALKAAESKTTELSAGDLDAAEKCVRLALLADPKSLAAHVALAKISVLKKDEFEAEDEFNIVAKLAPLRSTERLNLAEFKFSQGAVGEARALVEEVTRQAGDYLPAGVLSARLAAAAKDHDAARTMLQKVTDIDPDNFEARLLQVQLLSLENKVEPAIVILENLLKVYPGQPMVQYYLAKAWLQTGERGKALPLLTQIVDSVPDFAEAATLLGGLQLQRGQPDEVISRMSALLKLKPGLVQAILLQAVACQAAGRPSEGINLMKNLVREVPANALLRLQLGAMHRHAGEVREARQAFEEALKLAPGDLNAVNQLVDLDIKEKHFDEAHERVKKVLEKTPESAGALALEGQIFAAQQKWDEAEAALQKSIKANPDNGAAYQLLLRVFVDARKLPQALDQANQLLAKQPDDQKTLLVAALICEEQRDFAKARDHYEKLLALKPGDADVMNNLACLYSEKLNDPGKAYDLAREASKLRPPPDPAAPLASRMGSSAIADTLGWILYKRKEYREAFEYCQGAARDLGENPHVQYHFGMAAAMMGEIETARTSLAAAMKPGTGLPEDLPARAEIQARLDLMGGSGTPPEVVPAADLEAAAQKQPGDPFIQLLLGMACERESRLAPAAAAYEKAAELNPAMVAALTNLARLKASGNPAEALTLVKRARQLAPDDAVTAGILGAVAFDAGDYRLAYDLLTEGKGISKPSAAVLRNHARAAYSQGKVTDARDSMQQLINDFPESPDANDAKLFLALTAPALDDKAVAEMAAAAETRLQSDPGNVPALMIRARNQALKGETAPAIATCSAVLARFPDFTPVQIQLAALYTSDPGTREKAWELASKARQVLPNDPDLIRTLAALSFYNKDYPYAIQLLQPDAAKGTLNAESLYYLGMSQWQNNDKAGAQLTLKRALDAGLPKSLADEANKILGEGSK